MRKKKKNRGYAHLSRGVLSRIGAHPEGKELSTILGDCTPRNNFNSIKDWIIALEPDLNNFSRTEIEFFTEKLKEILTDATYF